MESDRLAAFSDGVIAVIITIMVLELKAPHGTNLAALVELGPVFLSYVLSFVYVAIYWNNHHHLLRLCPEVTDGILWANMHLLFWLSLVPFATSWAGENHFEPAPTAFYGVALLMPAFAWTILQAVIIRSRHGAALAGAVGRDLKGKASVALYVAGSALAFVNTWLADLIYAGVAVMWLIPDRRMARAIHR